MFRRLTWLGATAATLAFLVACSQAPQSPVSPSAVAGSNEANPDGSTLKVSAPTPVSPANASRTDSVRPTVVFRNAVGRFTSASLSYRLQVLDATNAVIAELPVSQDPSGQTSLAAEADLAFDTEYRWRVRAELEGQPGPWSEVWSFRTVQRVVLGTGDNVGPPRNIGFSEAYDILFAIYQAARWDISGGSSRDQMNLYLETAMAALHYGHGKWNPRGPDSNWCIKTGGPGRPQSDDVIVRCSSRDAWDLIAGIGARGAYWAPTYIGVLPSIQQVYPPRASTLARLP